MYPGDTACELPDPPLRALIPLQTVNADASAPDVPGATVASNPETARPSETPSSRFIVSGALIAGLVAGGVFLLLEVLASSFGAGTPIGPARATVQNLFGVASGTFSTLTVHFGLALATTAVLGRVVHAWRTYVAVILGGAFGGFLYTANVVLLWASAPAVSIGGEMSLIVNYIVFGAVAAGIYKFWQHRQA